MADTGPVDSVPMRPATQVTWTADYKGTTTNFRLVMNDAPNGGDYTIEKRETDALGKASWTTFADYTSTTVDSAPVTMTPKVITAMLDAIYTS